MDVLEALSAALGSCAVQAGNCCYIALGVAKG